MGGLAPSEEPGQGDTCVYSILKALSNWWALPRWCVLSCGPRTLVMVEPEPGMCTYKHTHHMHVLAFTHNHILCTHVYMQPHSMCTCVHIITQSRTARTRMHMQPHTRHTSTTRHVHINTPTDTENCTYTPELSSSNTCPSVTPSPNSIC